MGKNGSEEIEVMDTPDRCKNKQIAASACKFEESPVFSFLNSLSPIKPVKSTHITQTINPLTFASLPSVFTSPHVSSLKDYRLLQRCQFSDPSNPEFSSDNASTADKCRANMEASKKLEDQKENRDPGASNGEMAVSDPAENPSYDCKSPDSNLRLICALKEKTMAEYSHSSSTAPFVEEVSERGLSGRKENLRGLSQTDQSREASCDWESLISDATDMLIFESPNDSNSYKKAIDPGTSFYTSMENEEPDSYKKAIDPGTSFFTSMENEEPDTHSPIALATTDQVREGSELENLSTQPGEISETTENAEIYDIKNPCEKMDYEHISGFYRGMRRRCLVFEMAEARRKQLDENSGPDSPALLQSNDNTSTNEQQLAPAGNEFSRSVLPGIGLHLNALATTPKNYKIVSYEASTYERFLIRPTSAVNIHPPTSSQELLHNTLAVASSEIEFDTIDNGTLHMEDERDASGYIANEDINQSGSPKKKRRRAEQTIEDGTCKRCNCKKSKCLKLYCECFAAGVYCVEPCACIDCFNKPVHEDTVLATRKQIESRNPLAFAPKVIRASDSVLETADDSSKTPTSARHKRGCNCKKSGCLKKYCECYQGGVGCSINCRCEGCKNAFGRKDGSCVMGMDVEIEDEIETTEKSVVDESLKKTAIENEREQNMDSSPLATPLRAVRQSVSKNKPPRSSFTFIGSSSNFVANQASLFQPPSKFDKHFETVWEDEIPEFLQVSPPISGVKSSSPNRKRVSSPHSAGMMSGLRSSRKLILRSIPPFPSLGPSQ